LSLSLELESNKVRNWVRDLLAATIGEIGISWEKFHAVIDDMEKFVKEQEARRQPEAGPF